MTAKNLRQFEFKLGKLGLALFIVGLSVLVFAGFLLGVQVGRNIDTYPEMMARGIPGKILGMVGLTSPAIHPELPAGPMDKEPVEAPAGEGQAEKTPEGESKAPDAAAAPPPPTPAADAKENPVAPDTTASEKPPLPPLPVPRSAASALPSGPVKASAADNKGKETAKKEKTAPEAKASSKPAAKDETKKDKAPAVKTGRFTVQVVSFREKEKAESLGKKIRALGYTPDVSITDVPGKGQWYRVTVEGFDSKPSADRAADTMTKQIKGISCVVKANK